MQKDLFPNSSILKKIGGKVRDEYLNLKRYIMEFNERYFTLLLNLYLTEDIDLIITLYKKNFIGLQEAYINRVEEKIEEGKIKKENVLAQRSIEKCKDLPPEERAIYERREIHRRLAIRFKEIASRYGLYLNEAPRQPEALEICRSALIITPYGIGIDAQEFIRVYEDYVGADQSETAKKHKEVAETINAFFNGVEITEKELFKYFEIKNGRIIANPKSINSESYTRLGRRTPLKRKRNEE